MKFPTFYIFVLPIFFAMMYRNFSCSVLLPKSFYHIFLMYSRCFIIPHLCIFALSRNAYPSVEVFL